MVEIQRYALNEKTGMMQPDPDGQWVRWRVVDQMQKEIDAFYRERENISEALNSGDGTYRP